MSRIKQEDKGHPFPSGFSPVQVVSGCMTIRFVLSVCLKGNLEQTDGIQI